MGVRAVTSRPGESVADVIAALTREVPDFPEPGIQFKDLTPVLADTHGFAMVTGALAEIAEGADLVAGIDARGFLLGGAVAHRLGIGVLAIRKGGKLPPPVHSQTYALEYGTATLEIPADGIDLTGRRIASFDAFDMAWVDDSHLMTLVRCSGCANALPTMVGVRTRASASSVIRWRSSS